MLKLSNNKEKPNKQQFSNRRSLSLSSEKEFEILSGILIIG